MAIDLVKENIECEQLLGENFTDSVIKAEYVIPDTHPDVYQVLMLEAKPFITNREVMQDKVFLEGQIEYNVLYLAREEENSGIYNVTYTGKFSNNVDLLGAGHKMPCEAECFVEHIEPVVVNERKIAIEGVVKLKAGVYRNYDFEMIKDISGVRDIQLLKDGASVDKVVGNVDGDLIVKSHIQIPMDKPQIGTVLKCDINLHKKDVKLLEGKIQVGAFAHVELLYRGKDTREVCYVEDDVFVNKELDAENIDSTMDNYTDFRVEAMELDVKEDDLGEKRIVDVEALVKSNTRVMYKAHMDTIEDAYSPSMTMNMTKKDYELNVMHGQSTEEAIVKGNIELSQDMPRPVAIIMTNGRVCVTDKKIVEDKVVIEGLLNVDVLYRTADEDKYVYTVYEEIPFSCGVDMAGAKIDMQSTIRAALESIDATIEANTIAIKAIIEVYARVNYTTHKDFLVDVVPMEGDVPKKKASITIYVVQSGDNLWKIAKRYNTTIDNLMKVNELDNPEAVSEGQTLIIPGRAVI